MGLFTRFGGPKAAITSLVAGVLVWSGAKWGLEAGTPYLMGLAAAFASYVAVAMLESRAGYRANG
jgi:hypothetical protein